MTKSEITRQFRSIEKPKFASKLDPDSYTRSEYFTAMGALSSMPDDLVRWMLPKLFCFLIESNEFEAEEISAIVDFARFLDFEMKSSNDPDGRMLSAGKRTLFAPFSAAQSSSVLSVLLVMRGLVAKDKTYSFLAEEVDPAISAWQSRVEPS